MSLQDFALGVLASVLATVICRLSQYACPALKKAREATKALTHRTLLKVFGSFDPYEKVYPFGTKPRAYHLLRRLIFSPVNLSFALFILLMILTPFSASRITEPIELGQLSLRETNASVRHEVELLGTDLHAVDAVARPRLRVVSADEIVIPLE